MKMKMEGLPLHLCHSQYTSLTPIYPLRFLFLLFTISISCLPSPSRACPGFTCGRDYFPYPFGGVNSGCGDPALQLECDSKVNMALIKIRGSEYYILQRHEHDDDDRIMKIIDKNQWSETCNLLFSKHTAEIWSSTQFHIIDGYMNVTLWEECPPDTIQDELALPLACNHSWYVNLTEGSNLGSKCKSEVTFPVSVHSLPINTEKFNYDGFDIQWDLSKACWDCESRKRLCTYDITNSTQIYCKRSKSKSQTKTIILGSFGGFAITAAVAVFIYYMRRRKAFPTRGVSSDFSHYKGTDIEGGQKGYMLGTLHIFPYQELQQATNFFDEKNELGDGGFGAVYLGKLEDGRAVAVKRLYQENSRRIEQFINEVQILSSLYHPNLVRLYGCTSAESPILLLVYEYVPNGTLADHLHGSRRSLRGLPWGIRLKIALQTAQALAYLHSIEPPIFHRDVKSNNILLDEHLGAKVADFGLSRLVPVNVSHVTTAPQGTPGYVDPEYNQCFQLTEKSDVYSFGVVLVEIISAKVAVDTNRNRNEISLAKMAIEKIRRGVLDELVDPDLKIENNHAVKATVAAVAELAIECLARERDLRPSMKEVVARLQQIQEMLQQSVEFSKLTSISPTASPLSVPIMGSERSGQYWVPLSV